MRRSILLAVLCACSACTPFFSTDLAEADGAGADSDAEADVGGEAGRDGGLLDDVVGPGACCRQGVCDEIAGVACAALGGEFQAGVSCQDSGCVPTCTSYCSEFIDSCSSVADDYANLAGCVAFCERDARWPLGTFEDQAQNTVGCRLYHASFANEDSGNRVLHCGHAGIGGDDVCGSWCANYCHLATNICGDLIFDDLEQCLEQCPSIRRDGASGDTTGDTIQCRIYHLTAAARSPRQREAHCMHASPTSAPGTCVGDPP